jgi:hypothetical protein
MHARRTVIALVILVGVLAGASRAAESDVERLIAALLGSTAM